MCWLSEASYSLHNASRINCRLASTRNLGPYTIYLYIYILRVHHMHSQCPCKHKTVWRKYEVYSFCFPYYFDVISENIASVNKSRPQRQTHVLHSVKQRKSAHEMHKRCWWTASRRNHAISKMPSAATNDKKNMWREIELDRDTKQNNPIRGAQYKMKFH